MMTVPEEKRHDWCWYNEVKQKKSELQSSILWLYADDERIESHMGGVAI